MSVRRSPTEVIERKVFSHGNDNDLVLHRLRGGEHHHDLHQSVAQQLTTQQKTSHAFSSSGLDKTMYLKFINSRFAGIIFILGHLTWFAEWDETVNETLPVNDVPPEILLEVLRLTGRRIHPIDTEPTAFRRSDTIQKQFGFRIIEQCVDSTTRFHEREFGADVFCLAMWRVQVLDRLHRAAQGEQFDSSRLHLAVVRQRKHVTDPIGFRKIVIRVLQEPVEINAFFLAMYGDANPMRGRPALPIAERNPHVDGHCQKRQGRRQQRYPQGTGAHKSLRNQWNTVNVYHDTAETRHGNA
uniref:hypothetical protein n=1 Tax=Bifidobacterium adolescentis TaxID=1680 RepID=UPI00359CA308